VVYNDVDDPENHQDRHAPQQNTPRRDKLESWEGDTRITLKIEVNLLSMIGEIILRSPQAKSNPALYALGKWIERCVEVE